MNGTRSLRRKFQIGHVTVTLISKNPTLLELAGGWLSPFEAPISAQGDKNILFTMIGFESNERVRFPLPADARLLYKHKDDASSYYEYRGLWLIFLQTAIVLINRALNRIVAFVHYNDLKKPQYQEGFMHPLLELLRENGIFVLHAAAVSLEGRGLLLPGKSGQGKTALAAELLRNGFDLAADGCCFIGDHGACPEVFGFCEPSSRSPEIPIMDKCRLSAILFPYDSPHEPVSRIEPMTRSEALMTVLPLTMICLDQTTSQSHFSFCAKLVKSLPAAKLILGQDRERWHELVREYLLRTAGHTIPFSQSG